MKNTKNSLLTLCGKYFSLGLDKINDKDYHVNQKKLDLFLLCMSVAPL